MPIKTVKRLVGGVRWRWVVSACAGKAKNDVAVVPPGPPVEHIEMDPIKITAVQGAGRRRTSRPSTSPSCSSRAGKALSDKRFDDADRATTTACSRSFRTRRFTEGRASTTAAWPTRARRTGRPPSRASSKLASELRRTRPTPRTRCSRLGASYAEMGNWPTSATIFAELLERKDLNADDKIEAMARRGFAQFQLKDLDTAERTFSSALYYYRSIEKEERLQTDFYLGLVQYHLGQIPHERFRAIPLRLPEKQMAKDMERQGARCSWRPSGSTSRRSSWATRSGRRRPATRSARCTRSSTTPSSTRPIPARAAWARRTTEKREVYYEELRKKIRILLEKSLRTHEQNLADAGAPGRPERVAGQVQAGLRQAAEDAGPELQVRVRRPGNGRQPDAWPPPPPPPARRPPTAPDTGAGGTPAAGRAAVACRRSRGSGSAPSTGARARRFFRVIPAEPRRVPDGPGKKPASLLIAA